MKPSQRWREICAGRVQRRDDLASLEKDYGPHQLLWAMERYVKTTPYPNVKDLEDWIGRQELPEDLVCAAYLSGEPAIVRLADTLETMLGAMFPEPADLAEIEQLRERLGKVLL